ncbi:ABC transporter permease [Bacillus sp. FJAT-18017]|uniref:ABC transporter permease n=1 Tax=Bacillus sp. FJAT-18017 TaxID=1705566 RepID=UPI0006AF1123|nr:ABC transporter permease [Bacillus sp. FJAT-18017]
MIIWNEIRKLFEWKAIVLLFLISMLMYQLFISFDIKYFPNGRPLLDVYNVSTDMIRDYGTVMDEQEFKDFKSSLSENIEEADKYLLSKEEYVEAGITTYEEYKNLNVWDDPEASKLHGIAIFEDNVDAFWEIQAKQGLFEDYEEKGYLLTWHPVGGNPTDKEKERLTNIAHSGAIFPEVVLTNYNSLISYMCVLILLSIIFLVSPIFIRDKNNKMIYLHYSSKIGRNLFKKKLTAAVIGAFIITTVQLGAFFIMYSPNGTGIFLKVQYQLGF